MLRTTNEIIVQSLGGAETVTGSKHLLRTPELSVLIDCGLFQGLKELRLQNWAPLPVNPAEIDVMILTHAHLDHCGYIPLFIKNGFKGKIYMTPPTRELAKVILMDSAKIQEEDAERANQGKYSKHHPALPLYTVADAANSFAQFIPVDDEIKIKLSDNISFSFVKNGHILGSSFVNIKCYQKTLVFSGDIGRFNSTFFAPPRLIRAADFVFVESTYGDRLHDKESAAYLLSNIIIDTFKHFGNVLIPAFAVGRAQELIKILSELKRENHIPPGTPVYLDSPMAADATGVLVRFPEWHLLTEKQCAEIAKDVIITREFQQTALIIANEQPKVVIAASGMLTGGRVLEYMKHYAPERKNTIVLTGFQAEGTRGRALLEGKKEIKIHGQLVEVNAKVEGISSLSAHADQQELLTWLKGFEKKPQKIFLIHGEPNAMQVFKEKITDELHIPTEIMPKAKEVQLFTLNN